MSTEMQPLFWRISDQDHSGVEVVSLLMPAVTSDQDPAEFPTDVSFRSNRTSTHPVDLRWSEEDSDLFMTLLDRLADEELECAVELNLSDSVIQGIVQLVALARFKTPWPTDELTGDDFITEREELEMGDVVALNTRYGYPLAIIVGLDPVDATCILLDPVFSNGQVLIPDHSVLIVNRLSVLPATFADSDRGEEATHH